MNKLKRRYRGLGAYHRGVEAVVRAIDIDESGVVFPPARAVTVLARWSKQHYYFIRDCKTGIVEAMPACFIFARQRKHRSHHEAIRRWQERLRASGLPTTEDWCRRSGYATVRAVAESQGLSKEAYYEAVYSDRLKLGDRLLSNTLELIPADSVLLVQLAST